jgi:UDP-N-acetylglucosamine transferase subunit ALG13
MKIFAVVGSQIPFDRLISAIDNWAESRRDMEVFAQIGDSKLSPRHMQTCSKLSVEDFNKRFDDSDLIISHAGMGVIIRALEMGKPVLVVPRQASLGECTTDHQLATARAFRKSDQIHVAMDTAEMITMLNDASSFRSKHKITEFASDQLINTLVNFIEES